MILKCCRAYLSLLCRIISTADFHIVAITIAVSIVLKVSDSKNQMRKRFERNTYFFSRP